MQSPVLNVQQYKVPSKHATSSPLQTAFLFSWQLRLSLLSQKQQASPLELEDEEELEEELLVENSQVPFMIFPSLKHAAVSLPFLITHTFLSLGSGHVNV